MKKICILLFFLTLSYFQVSRADIEFGIGTNSSFSGRIIPTATGAISFNSQLFSFISGGVKNSYYYHSVYGLNWFVTKQIDSFLGGPILFGLGGGAYYSERFLKYSSSENIKKSDYVIGPSIRMNWSFLGQVYLNFDMTYGLRSFVPHILLNFQDVITTSIGYRF